MRSIYFAKGTLNPDRDHETLIGFASSPGISETIIVAAQNDLRLGNVVQIVQEDIQEIPRF